MRSFVLSLRKQRRILTDCFLAYRRLWNFIKWKAKFNINLYVLKWISSKHIFISCGRVWAWSVKSQAFSEFGLIFQGQIFTRETIHFSRNSLILSTLSLGNHLILEEIYKTVVDIVKYYSPLPRIEYQGYINIKGLSHSMWTKESEGGAFQMFMKVQ